MTRVVVMSTTMTDTACTSVSCAECIHRTSPDIARPDYNLLGPLT